MNPEILGTIIGLFLIVLLIFYMWKHTTRKWTYEKKNKILRPYRILYKTISWGLIGMVVLVFVLAFIFS